MVALMAKRPSKTDRPEPHRQSRAPGTRDVFARVDAATVDKLDELVDGIRPATSRSAVIALLIQQYVDREWPEHEKRQAAKGN